MDVADVVGRFLIDEVVEPVAEEEVGVGAPTHDGTFCRVIVDVIMNGYMWIHALFKVAAILKVECAG